MRPDLKEVLERQAIWQLSRARQSWAEKLRASVRMRRTLKGWRLPPKNHEPNKDELPYLNE